MRKVLLSMLYVGMLALVSSQSRASPGAAAPGPSYSIHRFPSSNSKTRNLLPNRYYGMDEPRHAGLPLFALLPLARGLGAFTLRSRGVGSAFKRERYSSRFRRNFSQGLLIGDYRIIPNLVLSTDNRYDNASSREYALRQELNWLDARQHGDIPFMDPLSVLLENRNRPPLSAADIELVLQIQRVANVPTSPPLLRDPLAHAKPKAAPLVRR
jgi:hypothetical protein